MSELILQPVMGIDPGPVDTGLVLWNGQKVLRAEILLNEEVFTQSLDVLNPTFIEMIASYGMPVGKETFETCLWIGRMTQILDDCKTPWRLVYRREVKLHHCGNMHAKDANIAQALRDKYGDKGTMKNPGPLYGIHSHLWSALAIATYAMEAKLTCPSKLL